MDGINRLTGSGGGNPKRIKGKLEEEVDKKKTDIVKQGVGEKLIREQPEAVKQIVDATVEDKEVVNSVAQDIDLKNAGAAPEQRDGVSSQFTEALTYFLPTIIGGVGGALFEGSEGALAGMNAGQEAGEGFRKFQMDKERLGIQQQQAMQAGNGGLGRYVNEDTGKPLQFDFQSGRFLDAKGKQVDPSKAIDKTVFNTQYRETQRKDRFEVREDRMGDERVETALKDFRKENQKIVDSVDTMDPIIDILGSTTPITNEFIAPFLARGVQKEVGNLSETDLANARVPMSIYERYKSDAKGLLTGNMSEEERGQVKNLITLFRNKSKEQLRTKVKNFASEGRTKRLDIDRGEFSDQLMKDFGVYDEPKKSGGVMTEEQRKRREYLTNKYKK